MSFIETSLSDTWSLTVSSFQRIDQFKSVVMRVLHLPPPFEEQPTHRERWEEYTAPSPEQVSLGSSESKVEERYGKFWIFVCKTSRSEFWNLFVISRIAILTYTLTDLHSRNSSLSNLRRSWGSMNVWGCTTRDGKHFGVSSTDTYSYYRSMWSIHPLHCKKKVARWSQKVPKNHYQRFKCFRQPLEPPFCF